MIETVGRPSQEFAQSRQAYREALKALFVQSGVSPSVSEEAQTACDGSAYVTLHIGETFPPFRLPVGLQFFADEAFQESFDVGNIIFLENSVILYSEFRDKPRTGRDTVPNRIEFKFGEADTKISSFGFVYKPGNMTHDASRAEVEKECLLPILDELTSMIPDLVNMQGVYCRGLIQT